MFDPNAFETFIRNTAAALRAKDTPPATRGEWDARRSALRDAILAAAGPSPKEPCPFKEQALGVLERPGYRIEKLAFQSRPDVWVTASLYVPAGAKGKRPAVLAVHGHHAWARIDPAVQAYCLGLARLGFVVLAVDAFGAGERHAAPARGTYHGALDGAALWPVGQTLLGMQLYDNRRAVDFLLTRPDVDPGRLGVTGASGGGNQSMYAGALDERLRCVVPVCSVGNYQAYLHAACCVCEVLPGALRFTEEGDVLGLIAPRALLVINASKDDIQFSPAEAAKSVARARAIYGLYGAGEALKHTVVEGTHGYDRTMREAMYGWMTRWLKGEGDGAPVAEPAYTAEDPEALRCYPDLSKRPSPWLTPTTFALRIGRELLAVNFPKPPDHAEEWESTATYMRSQLRKLLGDTPAPPRPAAALGRSATADGVTTMPLMLTPEPGLPLDVTLRAPAAEGGKRSLAVLLHLDGRQAALQHPLAAAFINAGWAAAAPNLRATGDARPPQDSVRDAADHNAAEHALWIGRPLLGQWLFDVQVLLDWLALQPSLDRRRTFLAGVGAAGLVALAGGGLWDDRVAGVVALETPASYLTDAPNKPPMRMGVLLPGVVGVGDVPQLAGLLAPRRLVLADGVSPQGARLNERALRDAYAFTAAVYKAHQTAERLNVAIDLRPADVVAGL
jgi:dienelactone hydrolase